MDRGESSEVAETDDDIWESEDASSETQSSEHGRPLSPTYGSSTDRRHASLSRRGIYNSPGGSATFQTLVLDDSESDGGARRVDQALAASQQSSESSSSSDNFPTPKACRVDSAPSLHTSPAALPTASTSLSSSRLDGANSSRAQPVKVMKEATRTISNHPASGSVFRPLQTSDSQPRPRRRPAASSEQANALPALRYTSTSSPDAFAEESEPRFVMLAIDDDDNSSLEDLPLPLDTVTALVPAVNQAVAAGLPKGICSMVSSLAAPLTTSAVSLTPMSTSVSAAFAILLQAIYIVLFPGYRSALISNLQV